MPVLFQYLLKLSCSVFAIYLFYSLVLRRLTFYTANRWYLLAYSLLCFFIPLLNITHLIGQHKLSGSRVVQVIPVIETYTGIVTSGAQNTYVTFTIWDGVLLLFTAGAVVLLFRLGVQYLSFRRIRRRAQLLTDDGIKVYQVENDVIPFSFGNAIFINQHLHSDAELEDIIRHEFVHAKQRHTIDILLAEFLCIINWYNPAAWLLRHAIRQNLEFIADNQVLQSGIDKKEYQYLLLKVMGQPQFRMVTPFNVASLKKRIVMMNKLKSARVHLIKFLFVLPLLAVLLLAFRNVTGYKKGKNKFSFTVSGLVVDAITKAPLGQVALTEIYSNTNATTDEQGFYTIQIPVLHYPLQTEIHFSKPGRKNVTSISSVSSQKLESIGTIEVIGMPENSDEKTGSFIHSYALSGAHSSISTAPTYKEVLKNVALFEWQPQAPKPAKEAARDTVPAPPSVMVMPHATVTAPNDYKAFLTRNPDVAGIRWSEREMIIQLKSGKTETYLRDDAKSMAAAAKKWGTLPAVPPPPPPPPVVTPPSKSGPVSKNSNVAKEQDLEQKQSNLAQLNSAMEQERVKEISKDKLAYDNERIAMQKEQQAKQEQLRQNQQVQVNMQQEVEIRVQKEQAHKYMQQKTLKIEQLKQQEVLQKKQNEMQIRIQKQQEIHLEKKLPPRK